jgi:hypothetical protein
MRFGVPVSLATVLAAAISGTLDAQASARPTTARRVEAEAVSPCKNGFLRRRDNCITIREASDAEIRAFLVEQSIASYSGNCPCPYFTDRAGRRCGARSAYSRPGGASPRCYPADVSADEIREARATPADST